MSKRLLFAALITCGGIGGRYSAQESGRVDFAADVQPIRRRHRYTWLAAASETVPVKVVAALGYARQHGS